MQVLQVKEYNTYDLGRFDEAWRSWEKEGGFSSGNYHPQQAFYCFYTNQGNFRQVGYVAFGEHRAVWRKTKREAIQAFDN